MNRRWAFVITAACGLLAGRGVAQPPAAPEPAAVRGDSAPTRKRLADAEAKLTAGHAADAADDLQRILDDAGDDLVTLDGTHFTPARWFAHRLLATLPADALRTYRGRVDGPAATLLEKANRDHDPRHLHAMLARHFVARPCEEGSLLLGDLLFERGEFRAAERVWRRLVPDLKPDVAFPDAKGDPAAVRGRVVLAAAFAGEPDRAKAELDALKAKHPAAAGPLAGTTGPYAVTLQRFLDKPPKLSPDVLARRSWPTYGGNPARDGFVPGPLPNFWASQPTWPRAGGPQATIPADPLAPFAGPAKPSRSPFGHPVVVGGRVYVTDGSRVFAFDLLTGERSTAFDARGRSLPSPNVTLTAGDGRLYARLGPPAVRPADPAAGKADEPTALVCFATLDKPGIDGSPLKELWRLKPPAAEGRGPGAWEGSPLVANRRLWAAVARVEGGRVSHSLACYDPADGEDAPRPAWVAEVCDGPLPAGVESRGRQELVTLAGRHVVFNSNAGAVVALDAVTGKRAWAFRYPRSARRAADGARQTDPAPAVYADGRVFVAPADADRVFALDADSGEPLWEGGPTDGGRLLGVARGKVFVTVSGAVRGLRALSVRTGSHREPEGWVLHTDGGAASDGQGFATDAAVLWPAGGKLWFLDPDTGRLLRPPLALSHPGGGFGHVAFADGCLVGVTRTVEDGTATDRVWCYVSEARLFGPLKAGQAGLGRLAADAETRLASGDADGARGSLLKATRGDLPTPAKAWAAARLIQFGGPAEMASLPTDVLASWVLPPDGVPVALADFARPRTATGSLPIATASPMSLALAAPSLAPTAAVERTVPLPAGSAPLRVMAGVRDTPRVVVVVRGKGLLAVPTGPGEPTRHAAPGPVSHAADVPGGFVVAGPDAAAVYGAGRDPLWTFRVPVTPPLPDRPGRPCPVEMPADRLSSFALAGPTLVARLGEHHLVALDLAGRRVTWVRSSTGGPRYDPFGFPDRPQYGPRLFADGRVVVAQLLDGRWEELDAATGRPLAEERGPRTAWATPPTATDNGRVLVPTGADGVVAHNLSTHRPSWTFAAGGDASLSGEPPQARAFGSHVLVAVRRNHGVDLERLEAYDGRSTWPGGAMFLDADRIDLTRADADGSTLFLPVGDSIRAVRLADGTTAWEAKLPATNGPAWVVRAGRRVVIAHPTEAVPAEPMRAVAERLLASFARRPLAYRLPGLAATLYHAWADRSLPVLLFDPDTGRQFKRIDVPARGPFVSAFFDRDTAVVATGDRVVWLK